MKAKRFNCQCEFSYIVVPLLWSVIVVGPIWETDTIHVMTLREWRDEYNDCYSQYMDAMKAKHSK